MKSSREGFLARRRRKKASRQRLAAKAEAVRSETKRKTSRSLAERRRARLKRHRAQIDELWVWTKGVGLEMRRRARLGWAKGRRRAQPLLARAGKLLRPVAEAVGSALRPVWRLIRAALAPLAPYVSGGLFLVLRGVGGLLDAILGALAWARDRVLAAARAIGRWIDAHVTAARIFAVIAAAAAVALAVSQFIDYRATAIGGEQYSGEAGTVAPVPRIDQKPTGDPHFYALLPLAVVALPLIWMALGGRWRLAGWVAAIGAVGVLVSLAVDLPQGLDTGRVGDAYEGTEAHLIAGFWTQLCASAVLLVSGLALGRASREAGEGRRRSAGIPRGQAGRPGASDQGPGRGQGPGPSQAAGSGAGA